MLYSVETLADSDNENLKSTENVILQMTSKEAEAILTKNRQKMIEMGHPLSMQLLSIIYVWIICLPIVIVVVIVVVFQ